MKKDKTTQKIQIENNNEELTVANTKKSTDGIGYSGNIVVKVQRGNKIISTKHYHNTGSIKLFNFIANCLAGNYYYNDRPCRIRLFAKAEDETPALTTAAPEEYFIAKLAASALIYYSTAPKVNTVKDINGFIENKYTVTYQFRIPYSLITTSKPVCKLALYNGSDPIETDYLAYFLLTTTGTDGQVIYDPIKFEDEEFRQNYSLIIEWTMEVANQLKSTTTTI